MKKKTRYIPAVIMLFNVLTFITAYADVIEEPSERFMKESGGSLIFAAPFVIAAVAAAVVILNRKKKK